MKKINIEKVISENTATFEDDERTSEIIEKEIFNYDKTEKENLFKFIAEKIYDNKNKNFKLESFYTIFIDYIEEVNSNESINFWLKNKQKYKLFYDEYLKYNTMFTSNGPLEQNFSLLKILTNDKRNRTKIEELNRRIILSDSKFQGKIEL